MTEIAKFAENRQNRDFERKTPKIANSAISAIAAMNLQLYSSFSSTWAENRRPFFSFFSRFFPNGPVQTAPRDRLKPFSQSIWRDAARTPPHGDDSKVIRYSLLLSSLAMSRRSCRCSFFKSPWFIRGRNPPQVLKNLHKSLITHHAEADKQLEVLSEIGRVSLPRFDLICTSTWPDIPL